MAGGLNTLLQALLGGAAGGFKGYAEGQYAKQQKEEREAEQKRLQDQFKEQMQLARDQAAELAKERDWDRTNANYASENPDADLTTSPNLASYERWGKPLTRTAAVSAPKISDSLTLPSLPSSAPSTGIGGAASTPMTAGKYDPNAEEEAAPAAPGDIPKPLPMGGPMTVATPTYGLGAPGKVTRTETRQEAQQRIAREAQIGTLKSALTTLGKDPLARGILEHSIKALEAGGNANITDNDLLAMQRAGEPPKPPASAQPDFEFINAFEIANNKAFDPATATSAEKKAAVDELARQKIAGTRPPASSGGSRTPSLGATSVPQDYQIVAGRVMGGRPAHARVAAQNTIQQLWESGDAQGLNSYIRQLAVESEPSTIKERITSRIETVDALQDAAALLRELKAAGVDTSLMAGGAERMAQYLGSTGDARLAALGTQLSTILMNYRRGITGAAFSASEAGEYAKIWPSISNNLALNEAQIDGLVRTLQGADASYWKRKLGDKGAALVGAVPEGGGNDGGGDTVEMVAPDGRPLRVPKAKVPEMTALGAKMKGGQ